MRTGIGLKIALRYLFSKKTHNAVNIIAGVAVATTAIATMAIVIVLSVFNGFRDLAKSRFSKLDPPYKLISVTSMPFDADSIISVLDDAGVKATALPVVSTKAFVTSDHGRALAEVKGVEKEWLEISGINNAIVSGVAFVGDTLGTQWAIAGLGIAHRLAFWPGSTNSVNIAVPRKNGRLNPGSLISAFRSSETNAAGVFGIDDTTTDNTVIFIGIDDARYLAGVANNQSTAIDIFPLPGFKENALKRVAEENGLAVKDLEQQNLQAFRMINIEKWISFALLAFILIIASFNIISTLTMLIIEKKSNMGVLKAMGLDTAGVRSIFIWEGILLSTFGALAGCIVGTFLVLGQQCFGWVKLSGDFDPGILSIDAYPVALNGTDFLTVVTLVIILSFIVTLLSVTTIGYNKKGNG